MCGKESIEWSTIEYFETTGYVEETEVEKAMRSHPVKTVDAALRLLDKGKEK